MADWLNALLSGPYTTQVFRDGIEVSDLSSVGASLSVVAGVMTLETPDDEAHQWDVGVTPAFSTPVPLRMRSLIATHPTGLSSATARTTSPGQNQVLTIGPPVSPDPVTFPLPAMGAMLSVVELEGT